MNAEIDSLADKVAALCLTEGVTLRFRRMILSWTQRRRFNHLIRRRLSRLRHRHVIGHHWHYTSDNCDKYAPDVPAGGFELVRLSARVNLPKEFREVAELLYPRPIAPNTHLTLHQTLLAGAIKRVGDGWSTEPELRDGREWLAIRDEYLASKCQRGAEATNALNYVLPMLTRLGDLARKFFQWQLDLIENRPELFDSEHAVGHPLEGEHIRLTSDFISVLPDHLRAEHDPSDPVVSGVLPLPGRELELVEKYVLLAAIHDAVDAGRGKIAHWPRAEECGCRGRLERHGKLWFSHEVEEVARLRSTLGMDRVLRDVQSDLQNEIKSVALPLPDTSSADTPKPEAVSLTPSLNAPEPKPVWVKSTYTLTFNGQAIKRVRNVSTAKFISILDAFEEEGWPPRIESPLSPSIDLNVTLRSLNSKLTEIRFSAAGDGEGILWLLER